MKRISRMFFFFFVVFFLLFSLLHGKDTEKIDLLMHQAVNDGDLDAVKQNLKSGFDINSYDQSGYSALHSALINNYKKIAFYLIENGADVLAKTKLGANSLHLVVDAELALFLIKKGVDVNGKDRDFGMTPLFFKDAPVAKILVENGADVHARSKDENTPLIWYAFSNNLKGITLLLENGSDINAFNKDGKTALDIAIQFHFVELKKFLISKGAESRKF